MNLHIIRILGLSLASAIACDVGHAEIQARAFWGNTPFSTDEKPKIVQRAVSAQIFVQLRNCGTRDEVLFCKTTSLIFRPKDVVENKYYGGSFISFVQERIGIGDVSVVPSRSELSPVELHPGEITQIEILVELKQGMDLDRVDFEFVVSREIGKRFRSWFGTLTCPISIPRFGHTAVGYGIWGAAK